MKPGKRDVPVRVRIDGAELDALHELTAHLCESFGLDRRIERYRGTRPIALYRWDLDLILDVLDTEVPEAEDGKPHLPDAAPLRSLRTRLRDVRAAEGWA